MVGVCWNLCEGISPGAEFCLHCEIVAAHVLQHVTMWKTYVVAYSECTPGRKEAWAAGGCGCKAAAAAARASGTTTELQLHTYNVHAGIVKNLKVLCNCSATANWNCRMCVGNLNCPSNEGGTGHCMQPSRAGHQLAGLVPQIGPPCTVVMVLVLAKLSDMHITFIIRVNAFALHLMQQ